MRTEKSTWYSDEETPTTWRTRLWLENDETMYSEVSEIIAEQFTAAISTYLDDALCPYEIRNIWEHRVAESLEEYVKELLLRDLTPFQTEMMECSLTFGVNFKNLAATLCDNVEEELETRHWHRIQPDGYVDWTGCLRVAGSYRTEAWRDLWQIDYKVRDGVDLDSPTSVRGIKAEFEIIAKEHQADHASTRVLQRPTFVTINIEARTVRVQESAMLHD